MTRGNCSVMIIVLKSSVLNLIFAIIILGSTVAGHGYQFSSGSAVSHTKADYKNPPEVAKFISMNQSFSVDMGEDITFPCKVQRKDDEYKMIFKFVPPAGDDRIIYAGDIKVTHFPRIQNHDSTFTLKKVHKADAGKYICRFETNPVMQLVHFLDVRYPAEVHRVGPKLQKVQRGTKVTLQCLAEGNPSPKITWIKEDGPLTSGEITVEGLGLTLRSVNLTDEGKYICKAFNGIGAPSTAHMKLEVEYPPEISTKQSTMFTKGDVEAHILCIVRGRPTPDVKWLRGDSLVSSDKHVMTHDGAHRHTLTITHVTDDDFGEYACRARNIYGEVYKSIMVTGLPKKPRITSSPAGFDKSSYNLTWETESLASIMQYRLRYRKAVETRKRNPIPWVDFLYTPRESTHVMDYRSMNGIFTMLHVIEDLESSEDYEATVRVENKYGWSPESDVFHFYTRKKISLGHSTSTNGKTGLQPSITFGATCVIKLFSVMVHYLLFQYWFS